jgi:hypothetical protein
LVGFQDLWGATILKKDNNTIHYEVLLATFFFMKGFEIRVIVISVFRGYAFLASELDHVQTFVFFY